MRLLADGLRIQDRYEVERFLGEGAFAEVYRVHHHILGRQAMKVFKRTGTAEETTSMLGEAIMLSQIGHPNIIRMFDAGTVATDRGDCGFFTMEYVAGGNLETFWASHRDRFVPVAVTVRIMHQIAEGLGVAHSGRPPIVHRDITPQNVLIGYDANGLRARIGDFGLAKRMDPLTMLASTRGTLAFKAPESLRNGFGDSQAGDVWAMGTIAYLLLTDTLPYEDSGGPTSFFGTQYRKPPRPPHLLNAEVDQELDGIVLATLNPDPAARTPNAGELAGQLARWRSRRTTSEAKQAIALPQATSKTVLGRQSPVDDIGAVRLVEQALSLARQATTLQEAADVMETAFNKSGGLRTEYEPRLRLWRKGIVT